MNVKSQSRQVMTPEGLDQFLLLNGALLRLEDLQGETWPRALPREECIVRKKRFRLVNTARGMESTAGNAEAER